MRIEEARSCRVLVACLSFAALLFASPLQTRASEFAETLMRIDQALATNPNHVVEHALHTCASRRVFAAQLYRSGHRERAVRRLRYCIKLLKIAEEDPAAKIDQSKAMARRQAKLRAGAARELEQALKLVPNIENGLEIYRGCAACHTPEGWGLASGVVPQVAGQHRSVVIKQLLDIRAGKRANQMMVPYASVEAIGGTQAVADVAGYIDTLEISVENGKGTGEAEALEFGGRLFAENCARCHGEAGEGDAEKLIPRIQAQHYNYLVTQFEQIRTGGRQNADPEMVEQIKNFEAREMRAVLDYVSRLQPPEALQAPAGRINPNFYQPTVLQSKQ